MQTSVPGVLDTKGESEATRKAYGLDNNATRDFGTQCLLARRLSEAELRLINALAFHEVIADHVADDMMPVLNPAHMRVGNVDIQLGHRPQLAPIPAGQCDGLTTDRIGILHGLQNIR